MFILYSMEEPERKLVLKNQTTLTTHPGRFLQGQTPADGSLQPPQALMSQILSLHPEVFSLSLTSSPLIWENKAGGRTQGPYS